MVFANANDFKYAQLPHYRVIARQLCDVAIRIHKSVAITFAFGRRTDSHGPNGPRNDEEVGWLGATDENRVILSERSESKNLRIM